VEFILNPKSTLKLVFLILLLASLACSFSDVVSPTPQTESELQTAVARNLAETTAFQTSVAQAVIGTEQVTWEARQTVIIEQTVTPATGYPLLSVSQATNCRSGPGSTYDWLGALDVGVQVEVYARDPYNTSWFIRNPNNPVDFCWIYGASATLSGDASALPIYTPMPTPTLAFTPTPVSDFQIKVLGRTSCGLGTYQAPFLLTNVGGVTWQSYRVIATDNATAVTNENFSNTFRELNTCTTGLELSDLTPGEAGYITSGDFLDSITGHTITAEITLCTEDSLSGICMTRIINFVAQEVVPN